MYGLGLASMTIQCAVRCRRARKAVLTHCTEIEQNRQHTRTKRQVLLIDWLQHARAQMLAKVGDRRPHLTKWQVTDRMSDQCDRRSSLIGNHPLGWFSNSVVDRQNLLMFYD